MSNRSDSAVDWDITQDDGVVTTKWLHQSTVVAAAGLKKNKQTNKDTYVHKKFWL